MIRLVLIVFLGGAVLGETLAGCGGHSALSVPTSEPPENTRVAISIAVSYVPDDLNATGASKLRCLIGKPLQLRTTESFSDGSNIDVTGIVTWQLTPSTAGTVKSGSLSCLENASLTIYASSSDCSNNCTKTGLTDIKAAASFPASLAIQAPASSLGAGTIMQLAAVESQITAQGIAQIDVSKQVVWASTAPNIAAIDTSTGLLKGVAIGSANITAALTADSGLPIASVDISVVQSPLIRITGLSSGQVVRPGSSISVGLIIPPGYSSPNVVSPVNDGATIQNDPLTATITIPPDFIGPLFIVPVARDANNQYVSGTDITVDVQPEAVPKFASKPSVVSLTYAGDQKYITVRGTEGPYAGKSLLQSGRLAFSSQEPTIARIGQDGLVTAVSSGNTSVTVALSDKSIEVPVSVVVPALKGDLDSSGSIDSGDYVLLDLYLGQVATVQGDSRDLNQDGIIDAADLSILKGLCGNACQ